MARIHTAARRGNYTEVAALLAAGADPNAASVLGHTALSLAVSEAHLDVVQLLLKSGADLNIPSKSGATELHGAVSMGAVRLVGILLEHGADPNTSDRFGHTPMITAAMRNDPTLVEMLKARGADATPRSREGMTADEWLETGGLNGWSMKQMPDVIREKLDCENPPLAGDKTEAAMRQRMARCPDPDEYVARDGHNSFVWGAAFERFRDPAVERWAHRVGEVLNSPDLQDACDERFLAGKDLEDARKRRKARDRYLRRKRAKEERIAACRGDGN